MFVKTSEGLQLWFLCLGTCAVILSVRFWSHAPGFIPVRFHKLHWSDTWITLLGKGTRALFRVRALEFSCVWESRHLSTAIRLCRCETRVCACAPSAPLWSHVFACNGGCDTRVRSGAPVRVLRVWTAGWAGRRPPACPRGARADVNSPWGHPSPRGFA